jgi:hypothetical protein
MFLKPDPLPHSRAPFQTSLMCGEHLLMLFWQVISQGIILEGLSF